MLEFFDTQFKNSIRYGMTYEQFWFGEPKLYYIYQDSYADRLKVEDMLNWQRGQYMAMAIAPFMDIKGRAKYPDTPIFFAKEEKRPMTVFESKEKFLAMVENVNRKFK